MKILAVDKSSVAQALIARRIESFDPTDIDSLDITVSLSGEAEFIDRVSQFDVLIIGSGLEDSARELARKAKSIAPHLEVLIYVTESSYSSGAFRAAHVARVRKVIPDNSSPLDLLQELVAIHEELRALGRASEGKVTAIVQAKGGMGATTIAAAFGEVCGRAEKRTLLWDLDVESRDLTRSLNASSHNSQVLTSFINGTREMTRNALKDATIPLSRDVSLLSTPHLLPEALDLVCHTDGISVAERIIELSRASYDNIIIDCAGRLGPLTGHLMSSADRVIVLVDDSVLGVSALSSFFANIIPLISNNLSAIRFLRSGTSSTPKKLMELVDPEHVFDAECWLRTPLLFDSAASKWPGTGKTLYSVGSKATKKALDDLVNELGLLVRNAALPTVTNKVVPLHLVHDPGVLPGSDTYQGQKHAVGARRTFFSF